MNNPTPPKPQNFMFLWYMVSGVYLLNAGYLYFFTTSPDMGEIVFNLSMVVVWLSIGYSFNYTPPKK
jgi:hypothetical protein